MEISQELLQKKILIVDDAASMRTLTKAIMREAGFTHVFDAPDPRPTRREPAVVREFRPAASVRSDTRRLGSSRARDVGDLTG